MKLKYCLDYNNPLEVIRFYNVVSLNWYILAAFYAIDIVIFFNSDSAKKNFVW